MRTWLRILISALVLGWLLARFDLRATLAECAGANLWLFLAAFAFYLASQLASALRWARLARAIGFRAPFGRCVKIYLTGMFFGMVAPSTLGSDATRVIYLGSEPPGRARALPSVLFDRVVGLVILIAIGATAIALGPSASLPRGLSATLGLAGVAITAAWFAAPIAVKLLPRDFRLRRLVEGELAPYWRDPGVLATSCVLSLLVHALQIVSQKLLSSALGLEVSLGFVAIYHPLVTISAALPITIGGFGLREAAYAYLLPFAGVGERAAIALGLLWFLVGALGGLTGGVVYAFSDLQGARELESRG